MVSVTPFVERARMQSQQVHLLRRLDRYEVHGRPLHGFCNRLGITVVVLMPLQERLDVLRWDQTNIMSKPCELAADVVSPRAGFHADQTARNIGKPVLKLSARALELQTIAPR